MLKTVSSIANAIGALNYKGTWDANANSPALASSVGTKGDYYVVGTAGATNLNGISNWGIGDWAVFNGSVWQRVEGGANLNGVDLSVSGTSTLSGLTASTALALNASKQVVSVTNTGTGNNVLATTPTLVGDVSLSTGNLVQGTAAKGVNFTANTPAAGMTSQLLNWYEEVTAPSAACTGAITTAVIWKATKVGNVVTLTLPTTVGAATASAFFAFGELLPAAFRPSATTVFPCAVRDNDVSQDNPGMILILSAGNIRVYRTLSGSAWTANASVTAAGLGQGSSFACSWTI